MMDRRGDRPGAARSGEGGGTRADVEPSAAGGVSPGSAPSRLRVSDAEREAAAARLGEHCAAGRLTLEELAERVGTAMAAVTDADLAPLFADLPGTGTDLPEVASAGPVAVAAAPPGRASGLTVAVMASASRRGRWRLRSRTAAAAVMGSCTLDLRSAEVTTPQVTVDALAAMGSVTVVVPEGIDVELVGLALMGSKRFRVRDVPPAPGSPRVRVRAWAVMGSVTVVSRPLPRGRRGRAPLRR